ncbi:hypothetical protein [Atopococcus tabaci]|uniref:hypothetical protein n=1 Tax=Atopococcus tabaci TaxID=269774 RepID=UPI00041E978C|nr:hypothetical protein [Atopococcus tabaci]
MNTIVMTGKVVSEEVKVLTTNRGVPLCRFTLESDGQRYSCLITGKHAYTFLYEVESGSTVYISARVNDRKQLVVLRYRLLRKPNHFGKVYDYKGHPLPHKKTSSF